MSETNTNNLEHFNLNCTSAAGVDRETSWNEKDTTMVIVFIILLLMALLLLFLALFTMLHRRRRRKKPKEELKEEVPELKELDECGVIVVSKMHSAKSIVSEKSDDNLVSAVEQSTTNDRTTAGPSYGLMSIHHKSLDKSYGNPNFCDSLSPETSNSLELMTIKRGEDEKQGVKQISKIHVVV